MRLSALKHLIINRSGLLGLILGALCYWILPLDQRQLFGLHVWFIMALSAFVASFIFGLRARHNRSDIAASISAGIVLAVILRILFDLIFREGPSHSLSRLEIIYPIILTLPLSYLGVYASTLFSKDEKC